MELEVADFAAGKVQGSVLTEEVWGSAGSAGAVELEPAGELPTSASTHI